jgi:VWFA-related protein
MPPFRGRRGWLPLLLAFFVIVAVAGATPGFGEPDLAQPSRPAPRPLTFPVTVENVNVDVSVTRGGRRIEGLTGADFAVTDNGVSQQVQVVESANSPVDAILVLDTSTSVRGARLEELRQAAHAFVDSLWAADSVTVIAFATDLRIAAPPGVPRAETHAAIDRLEGSGATELMDAVYAALLSADPRRGRPLVLVFSDGVDHGSWLAAEDVLRAARASEAVVHYVEADGDASFLASLATETGGHGSSARARGELKAAFVQALDEFKSRYRLRFEPHGVRREGWHALEVRLVSQRGRIKARRGYEVAGGTGER